jgi:hypothetical protein
MARSNWLRSSLSGLRPLLLAGAGFALAWLLPAPAVRSLGGWLRRGFDPWLVGVLFLLFYLLARLESRRVPGILAGGVACLLGLSLAALWTGVYSELQVAGGMIYFSDAHQYYTDAIRLLNGFSFSSFSARHPLPTVALAILLSLSGGNLQVALSATVFLAGMAMYFAAREALDRFGAVAASILLLLLFFFYRRFTGLPDSENLGILLGGFGFVFLLRGCAPGRLGQFLVGFSFFSLAMQARPGPLLALPLALLAPIGPQKGVITPARIKILAGALILIAGIGLNVFVVRVFAEQRSQMFSNFAYTFYGVAQGGRGWEQFLQDYPEYRELPGPEAEKLAFQYAWGALRENPSLALRGVLASYVDFFSLGERSAFGYLAGGEAISLNEGATESGRLFNFLARLAAGVLSVSGLIFHFRRRTRPENSLVLWILFGIFLSIPFLPPRDAGLMRVYAAAIPFLALLPGVGLSQVLKAGAGETRPKIFPLTLAGLGALTAALLVVGSIGLVVFRQSPVKAPGSSCDSRRTSVRLRVYPASYVSIREVNEIHYTRLPEVRIGDFRASLAGFHRQDLAESLSEIPAGHLILNAVNLLDGEPLWAILPNPSNDLSKAGGVISGCGTWQPDLLQQGFGFLIVDQFVVERFR